MYIECRVLTHSHSRQLCCFLVKNEGWKGVKELEVGRFDGLYTLMVLDGLL